MRLVTIATVAEQRFVIVDQLLERDLVDAVGFNRQIERLLGFRYDVFVQNLDDSVVFDRLSVECLNFSSQFVPGGGVHLRRAGRLELRFTHTGFEFLVVDRKVDSDHQRVGVVACGHSAESGRTDRVPIETKRYVGIANSAEFQDFLKIELTQRQSETWNTLELRNDKYPPEPGINDGK